MKLNLLAVALCTLSLGGAVSAQEITPDGRYIPGPQNSGSVIQPATYTTTDGVIYSMPQSVTYSQPGVTYYQPGMTTYSQPGMMTSGTSQFFPSSLPGSTVLNGTTQFVTTAGTTVVGGTRRALRRSLGILRR